MVCYKFRVEDYVGPPMAQRKQLLKVHLGEKDCLHRISGKIIFQANVKAWKRVIRYVRSSCVVVVGSVLADMKS